METGKVRVGQTTARVGINSVRVDPHRVRGVGNHGVRMENDMMLFSLYVTAYMGSGVRLRRRATCILSWAQGSCSKDAWRVFYSTPRLRWFA